MHHWFTDIVLIKYRGCIAYRRVIHFEQFVLITRGIANSASNGVPFVTLELSTKSQNAYGQPANRL